MEFHRTQSAPISLTRAVPWNSMEFHGTWSVLFSLTRAVPCKSIEFHGAWSAPISMTRAVPWNSMELVVRQFRWHQQFHGIPWNSMELECANFADTSSSMEFLGIPWNSMELVVANFDDPSSSMELYGIPWNLECANFDDTSSFMEFHLLWTPNLPYQIPAAVLQILPLVANLWGCRWDKFVCLFFIFVCCLRYLFCLSAYACVFKFIEYCFEINAQGMLGVDSASARPCFDGTTRGLLESNFWVVTACGRSYFSIGLCRLHLAPDEGQEVVSLWELLWRPWTPVGAISGRFLGTCGCVSRKGGVVLAVRRHVGWIRQQHDRECWVSNWWYFCSRGGS